FVFFFSSRRRHTRSKRDWSSDVCSSDLHEVTIPKDITILAKVILTLEDVIDRLDPDFSIMKAVEPFGKKLIRQRYNPKSMAKDRSEERRVGKESRSR